LCSDCEGIFICGFSNPCIYRETSTRESYFAFLLTSALSQNLFLKRPVFYMFLEPIWHFTRSCINKSIYFACVLFVFISIVFLSFLSFLFWEYGLIFYVLNNINFILYDFIYCSWPFMSFSIWDHQIYTLFYFWKLVVLFPSFLFFFSSSLFPHLSFIFSFYVWLSFFYYSFIHMCVHCFGHFAGWVKDSYTERFLTLLSCASVLQPKLIHL
jgi:hypothetical protein